MIDKYKQAFQEEAREILVELEAALLALNENRSDSELVGRAFRALHTIKGSGAMFGFDELAAFTHNLENAFDEVRNGRLQVTPELINLSLAALDQIKGMLEEAAGYGAGSAAGSEILAKLGQLTGKAESPAKVAPSPIVAPPTLVNGVARAWQIRFCPGPDLMRGGTNPLLLLRELKQMGSLRVTASMAAVPPLGELDPERCYITWDMVLNTSAAREAISDVFIFVADHCELAIEPAAARVAGAAVPDVAGTAAGAAVVAAEAPRAKYPSYGRRAYDSPDTASSIRVPAAKLDQFVNLVGELVTVQARLGEIATRGEDSDVAAVSEEVERLTAALRETSMSIRMLPIRATFERFRRLVHDLARDLHKEVELTIEGADTELDKTVLDQLNDPLMHLIRNSMDHGIEPRGRAARGRQAVHRDHPSLRAALGGQRSDHNRGRRQGNRRQRGSRARRREGSGCSGCAAYGVGDFLVHLGARLLHGTAGDGRVWPGSGDGRGPAQRGSPAWNDRHCQ